jgi:hypothetical protein
MVASLCSRSTEAVFRLVERNSGLAGSKTKSVGINAAGKTEEMYATRTSGMGPTGPASTSTGRNFIPAVSPNGKLARQISPGCIYGLAVRQSVKVLPHVAQLVTPSLRYVPGPKGSRLIVIRPDDNQMNAPGRQVLRRFSADLVVFVDFAHYADGSHTVDLSGSYHAGRAGPERSRGKVGLRTIQDGLAPDPVGTPLDHVL